MGCCNSTPGEKDGKQTISIPPLHREQEEHYKRSESTTQDNMFVLTDEVAEFFKAITTKKINLSTIPERSFQPQRSFQDVVNLYLCLRLGQYFAQEEKLFSKIQDSCKAELARKMKDGAVLDCLKYVNEFHQAQDLFDEITYKDEKAKLSVVANDTVDDSDDFIDSRIAAATEDLDRFKAGLISIIEELNLHSTPGVKAFDLEANVKKKQRTKEKILEMKEQTRKYPEPVENWLYDLIRCRFRISPTCLQGIQQKDTLHYVKEFLQKLGNKYRVIRYKNKMTELGVLSFNVVFETHIAEIQIVFTESFKKLNESHIVYDVSRTKDFKALKRYLETQVAVKHYRGLFESLKTHTITNLHQAQHEEGSVSMIPLFINLLTSPDNNDPLDIPITVKGKYCDKVIEEQNYLKLTVALADCESETNDWPSYLSFRLVLQQPDETRNFLSGKGIRYEAQLFSDRVLHEEEVEVKAVSEGSKTLVLIVYSNTNKSIKHTLRCQLNDTNKSVMIASKECGYYIEDDKDIPIIENPTTKVAPYTSCCLKGHRMYLSKVEEAYECSRCKTSVAKQKHPVCTPCSYHVCRNCVAPAGSNQRQQQSLNRKSLLEEQLKVIEAKIKKQSQQYDDERNQQLEDQRKKIQDKVKHIEEQSQQQEQSLRNQVSQTYTQSEAQLRKCPQGHFMKKLVLENRCCDECEDEIDDYRDHLVCLRCNYDLCRDCGEQEAGTRKKVDEEEEEEEEEELKALPTKDKNGKLHCLNDHIMTKAFRDEGYTTCDACGEEIDEDEKHHICYTCNYDLCNNCLTKVPVRAESDSDDETPKFKCPKGHTANLMVTRPRECDLCCQDTKPGERHAICEECNYDVCKKCVKIIEDESEPKNGFYILEFQPKGKLTNCKFQCPEGHPTPLRGVRNHHCDICREDIAVTDRHPLCRECDYDVCTDCCIQIVEKTKPKKGYYSLEDPVITSAKFKCPEGHVTPLNAEYGHACDICSANISPSENHPMCEECNYDVCIDCVKEIIEKTEPQGGFYSLQDPEITNAKFKCPDGHVMSIDAESGHFCDICEGKLGASEKRQLCSECNYDICLDCAKEIVNNEYPEDGYYQKEKTESGPKYKCPEGHPTPVLAIYGHSCDLCKAKISSLEKHPYCDECDYDVCADCAQEIVEKTEPEGGYYSLEKPNGDNEGDEENDDEEEEYKCPLGHPMPLVTKEKDVYCDNCDGNIYADEKYHECERCPLQICTDCIKYI